MSMWDDLFSAAGEDKPADFDSTSGVVEPVVEQHSTEIVPVEHVTPDVLEQAANVIDNVMKPERLTPEVVQHNLENVKKVATPFYERPDVQEMMNMRHEMNEMLAEFKVTTTELDMKYNAKKGERDEYYKEAQLILTGYTRDLQEVDRQRKALQDKAYEISAKEREISRNMEDLRERLRMQEENAALEAAWRDAMSAWDFIWIETIKPFQLKCLRFIVEGFEAGLHGVLVGDQMGLGKTLEAGAAINVIQSHDDFVPRIMASCKRLKATPGNAGIKAVLWLCPSSVKRSTVNELKKWGITNAIPLTRDRELRDGMVDLAFEMGLTLVVGYEQLRNRNGKPLTPALLEYDWPIVVLDEAHRFKTEGNSTFDNVEAVCETAGFIIPMTGTPILSKPQDLWSILHMLTLKGKYQGKFEDSYRFMNQYTTKWGSKVDFWGKDKLVKEVQDMVIRREKHEVLPDLPPKIHSVRSVEFSKAQRDVYNMVRDFLYLEVSDATKSEDDNITMTNFLSMITRLRQIALWPHGVVLTRPDGTEFRPECEDGAKLDEALDIVRELLENNEKVIIFCNYTEPILEMQRRINEAGLTYKEQPAYAGHIIGGMNEAKKDRWIEQFTSDDAVEGSQCAVMIGNISAMGIGLNLQGACSNVIFLDQYWNPGINEQAEDRVHRQGQDADSVNVTILRGDDCVDHFIAKVLNDKELMINGVISRREFRKYMDEGLI